MSHLEMVKQVEFTETYLADAEAKYTAAKHAFEETKSELDTVQSTCKQYVPPETVADASAANRTADEFKENQKAAVQSGDPNAIDAVDDADATHNTTSSDLTTTPTEAFRFMRENTAILPMD